MPDLDYVLVDCFTRNPLEGNQLAVVLDGRGLSTEIMQKVAKETNLSETTFILPGEGSDGAHRVRIFTVDEELPFAGHPTLGTAEVLRTQNGGSEVALDLNVGRVPVRYQQDEGGWFGEMRQRDPEFGATLDPEQVAEASGLPASAIDRNWPVQTTSTGMPFAIVAVVDANALRGLRFDWKRAAEYLAGTDAKFLYFVTRTGEDALEARMIFYNGEDPATGSAAGCCAAWAVRHGYIPPERQVRIRQGEMVRRPSEIFVRASLDKGMVTNVRVGGYCVIVGRGRFSF